MAEILRYTLSNPHRLPSPYIPLAFITSSTGSEYIDTGIKISDASNIAYKVRFTKRVLYSSYLTTSWYITGGGDFQTGIGSLYYYSNNTIYSLYINSYTHSKNTPRSFPENSIIDYYATIDFANATTTQWYNGENLGSGSFTKFTPGTGTIRICNNWKGGNHYGFRLWKDGSLVRDLVPCLNSSTSLCGLFDLVTQTFYSNSGTGSFLPGPPLRAIPSEYQLVEWLLSNGNVYIDTGFADNAVNGFELDWTPVGVYRAYQGIVGATYDNFNVSTLAGGITDGFTRIRTIVLHQSTSASNGLSSTSLNHVTYHGSTFKYNSSTDTSTFAAGTLGTAGTNIYMFGCSSPSGYQGSIGRIHSFKLYNSSNVLVADYVPCYRKSDMTPGMYDLVNNTFKIKSGGSSYLSLGPSLPSSGGLVEWNGKGSNYPGLPHNLHSSPLNPGNDDSSPAIGRNEGGTEFGRGDSSYKLVTNNFPGSSLSNCSISFWRKGPGAYQWLPFIGLTSGYYLAAQYAGCGSTYHANAGSPRLYCDGVKTTLFPIDSEWHHYVIAGANLSSWTKFQVNAYGGGWSGGGCYYDIRIFDNAIDRNSSGNEDLSLIQAIYLAK